eukprot:14163856-Alexandrium_andersonii.AAC.1
MNVAMGPLEATLRCHHGPRQHIQFSVLAGGIQNTLNIVHSTQEHGALRECAAARLLGQAWPGQFPAFRLGDPVLEKHMLFGAGGRGPLLALHRRFSYFPLALLRIK